MATIATLVVNILADVAGLQRNAKKANDIFAKIGTSAGKVGSAMTRVLTLPILGIGVASLKMSMDFNESMSEVATLIPKSTERVNELKSAVQGMAIAHGKSTTDLAKGLYQTISAFANPSDCTASFIPCVGLIIALRIAAICVDTSDAAPVTPVNVANVAASSSCVTPSFAASGVTRPIDAANSGNVVCPSFTV